AFSQEPPTIGWLVPLLLSRTIPQNIYIVLTYAYAHRLFAYAPNLYAYPPFSKIGNLLTVISNNTYKQRARHVSAGFPYIFERSTRKRTRFFEAYDRLSESQSLRLIASDCDLPYPTAHRWLQQ